MRRRARRLTSVQQRAARDAAAHTVQSPIDYDALADALLRKEPELAGLIRDPRSPSIPPPSSPDPSRN